MAIPRTRKELVDGMQQALDKLNAELHSGGPRLGATTCVDNWTVKELLAVRLWWTEQVVNWIEAGRRGETPTLPAEGFTWSATPALNNHIARDANDASYAAICTRLNAAAARAFATIDCLDDRELLEPGQFEWAGKWPLSRWLSINTTRQYTTARTYVRRALRAGTA